MADKKKGKGGDKGKAPAAKAEAPKAEEAKAERVEEKAEAESGHGHDAHGEGAHGAAGAHGAHAAHGHKPNIREYMVIFAALAVLTVLEVGVAQIHGVGKTAMSLTLIGLALTKAAIVALYYMHLKHETKVLKFTVALPMCAPTIYAIVLISEAAWRHLHG